MLAKIIKVTLLLILLSLFSCKGSKMEILKSATKKNSLFILNDSIVIIDPTAFIKGIKNKDIIEIKKNSPNEIEYKNNYSRIVGFKMNLLNNPILSKSNWIDFKFIKEVNPKNKIFYIIDGIPSHDYNYVFNYLKKRE